MTHGPRIPKTHETFDMLRTKEKEMIWLRTQLGASRMATTTLDDIRRRLSPFSRDI
jgi:hypothetical protein